MYMKRPHPDVALFYYRVALMHDTCEHTHRHDLTFNRLYDKNTQTIH